jgi:hypothetical protein
VYNSQSIRTGSTIASKCTNIWEFIGPSSLCFFFTVLDFELRTYMLSHSTSLFFVCVMGLFRDRISRTICPGWLRTTILLISASWVARITGVSHQHPACYDF